MDNTIHVRALSFNIDPLADFSAMVSTWTLDDLNEWLEHNQAQRKIVGERIKQLSPKKKRQVTKVFSSTEVKRKQASDIIYERSFMEQMIAYFLANNQVIVAGIAVLGFNTALRFGDIQKLCVKDVVDGFGNIKKSIIVQEEKNENVRTIYFNEVCVKALETLTEGKTMNDYIFRSPAPNAPMVAITDVSGHISLVRKYISKQAVCDAMAAFSTDVGINEHYRTHTFRKSCINLIARECPDIFRDRAYGNEVAAAFVGHKSVKTTEEYYLRLSEQERRTVHERLNIGLTAWNEWNNKASM